MAVASVVAPRAVRAQDAAGAAAAPPADAPASTATSATPETTPAPATRPVVGNSVGELRDVVAAPSTNTNVSPAERLEAARRLVARQSPEARDALQQVVTSPANLAARAAALRALADDPNPDPGLIDTLVAIVEKDPEERLVTPAALALGAYKNNPTVVDGVSRAASDPSRPQPLRAAAINALGLLVDPAAAATLVRLVTSTTESAQILADAADALVELTGVESNGRDPAKWRNWQTQNGNLPSAQWKAMVADSRSAREQRLRRRMEDLVEELQPVFEEQYRSTPPQQMPERLLKFLHGNSPEIRRIGARIANKAAHNLFGPRPTAEVQQRLEDLIGDADAGVRLDAIEALEFLQVGDRTLAALRQQLPLETDSQVKAAMARTMSKIPGIAWVSDVNALLDDPSPAVIREAADAIRKRAGAIGGALKESTAQKLRATITRLPYQPAFIEASRMCAEALAALQDPASMSFATELLRSPEPDRRAAGMTLLGELGALSTLAANGAQQVIVAPQIINAVDAERGQDPASIRVRKAGMNALGRAGDFNHSNDWLFNKFNPRGGTEPNKEVRNVARDAYRKLLPNGDTAKLLAEADRFNDDPSMRVEVLKVLVDHFTKSNQPEDAAFQQESLGAEYMKLANAREATEYTKVANAREAASALQDALNYHLGRGEGPAVTGRLVGMLTDALLQSQQYTKLAAIAQNLFTAKDVSDRGRYQQIIGSKIRNEAQKLQSLTGKDRQKDWANAAALIDAVSHMDPPLAGSYLDDLRIISTQLREQQRSESRPRR